MKFLIALVLIALFVYAVAYPIVLTLGYLFG
jgi:hypothetical protein